MIAKFKELYKIFRLLLKYKNLAKITEIIEMLVNMKQCVIMFSEKSNQKQDILYYISDDNIDIEFSANCKEVIRDDLIKRLGDNYDRNLEKFEPYTAMAFKEADYQMLRADVLDAKLKYINAINDAYGMTANATLGLWNHYNELKHRLKDFENS